MNNMLANANVRITSRDLQIMRTLYDNTVMSFEQIYGECFSGLARVTAYNRVNELVKAGVIDCHRVGNVVYQDAEQAIGNIYRVSRCGIGILQSGFGVEVIYRNDPFPWNTGQLSHDLLLNDVTKALKEAAPEWEFRNGKHIPELHDASARLPDALLQKPNTLLQVALELELTAKSDRRYREIILDYRLDRKVNGVLYIANDIGILRKIQSVASGGKVDKQKFHRTIGKFHFVTMAELLGDGLKPLLDGLLPTTNQPLKEVRL